MKTMTARERQIHVLDLVANSSLMKDALLPEELADLRSLLEDLKGEKPHLPDKDGYTQIQFTINVPEVRAEEMVDIIREKYPEARIRETWTLQPSKN